MKQVRRAFTPFTTHLQASTFGKLPGTVPSVFIMNYVQAHHLDLDFYDRFLKPGASLRTHAEHTRRWHGAPEGG